MATDYTSMSDKALTALFKEKLATEQAWVQRGIVAIYHFQTADEQATEDTKYHNLVGFSGADAKILSSFAKQILNKRNLSAKQLYWAQRLMPKYAGQLARIVKNKQ